MAYTGRTVNIGHATCLNTLVKMTYTTMKMGMTVLDQLCSILNCEDPDMNFSGDKSPPPPSQVRLQKWIEGFLQIVLSFTVLLAHILRSAKIILSFTFKRCTTFSVHAESGIITQSGRIHRVTMNSVLLHTVKLKRFKYLRVRLVRYSSCCVK